MNFVEIETLFVLPLMLAAYWLLPRKTNWQNAGLLLLSWVFYMAWDWRWLPLLWVGTAIDFFSARYMERHKDVVLKRRYALATSVTWNLGVLCYFKYANFFLDSGANFLSWMGFTASAPVLSVVLPLGISFYTLQRLSYVFDVYSGREKAASSLLNFAVYASYFPQLTAGPIARASELLAQLNEPRRLTADLVAKGAGAFLLGYALKAWLADSLGDHVVDRVFAEPSSWSVAAHWFALFGYALQVFGDFAGYSLIAIGCSRFFGIELPTNFEHPFLSRSLPEFWRRWHITLNRWLFDYIYSPLTTSRGWFRGRMDVALMITFLISGLWHGAAATFVLWGAIHGVGMVVQRRWDEKYRSWCRRDRRFVQWRKGFAYAACAWALTQLVFVLSLLPFRAGSVSRLGEFTAGMFGNGGTQHFDTWWVDVGDLLLGIGLVALYHFSGTRSGAALQARFFSLPAPVRGSVYGACIVYLLVFVPVGAGTFIYQQF